MEFEKAAEEVEQIWRRQADRELDPEMRAYALLMADASPPIVRWIGRHHRALSPESMVTVMANFAAHWFADVLKNTMPPGYTVDAEANAQNFAETLKFKLSTASVMVTVPSELTGNA